MQTGQNTDVVSQMAKPDLSLAATSSMAVVGYLVLVLIGYLAIKYGPGFIKDSFRRLFKEVIHEIVKSDDSPVRSISSVALEQSERFKIVEMRALQNEKKLKDIEGNTLITSTTLASYSKQSDVILERISFLIQESKVQQAFNDEKMNSLIKEITEQKEENKYQREEIKKLAEETHKMLGRLGNV